MLIPRLFLIRTLVCSVITTSQESQTPCTLTPQPQAANTPQGLCAHLIPTQHLGWAPKRDAQESPHLDATHPFPSLPPALAGLHLLQRPSRAQGPAPKDSALLPQGKGKTHTLELLTLQTPSEKRCLTLQTQKPSPGSPVLPAPPLIPMETHHRTAVHGAREMLAPEHCPRSHTQSGNLGLGHVLCIRMAESSEIVS